MRILERVEAAANAGFENGVVVGAHCCWEPVLNFARWCLRNWDDETDVWTLTIWLGNNMLFIVESQSARCLSAALFLVTCHFWDTYQLHESSSLVLENRSNLPSLPIQMKSPSKVNTLHPFKHQISEEQCQVHLSTALPKGLGLPRRHGRGRRRYRFSFEYTLSY